MQINELLSMLKKVRKNGSGWMACCPAHDDRTPSLSITTGDKGILLNCHGGCTFDSVVAALGILPNELFNEPLKRDADRIPKPIPSGTPKMVGKFIYNDQLGRERFWVERWEPGINGGRKSFKQRHKDSDGRIIDGVSGVELVLYRLNEIMPYDTVWIVEGEAKADAMFSMSIPATCCAGGCKSWKDGYAEHLAGKQIVICPDNDEPGKKFAEIVQNSLAGKVANIRIVQVDAKYNDVLDWLAESDEVTVGDALMAASRKATTYNRGYDLPIYSMADMEVRYIEFLTRSADVTLDLGKWIPTLKHYIRPLVPGEVVTFLAETGVGKTMLLQNVAMSTNLKSLLFEMELPDSLAFERFVSISTGHGGVNVEAMYRANRKPAWRDYPQASNIFVCPCSGLTPQQIQSYIVRSELIIGQKPPLVMVDYIQLISGPGNRRERIAEAAEAMKRVAKETETIICLASQVLRKGEDAGGEIFLNDGKEAGEIENSSGLVIGAWRDEASPDVLLVRSLKQTKGKPMRSPVRCRISDALRISEIFDAPQSGQRPLPPPRTAYSEN